VGRAIGISPCQLDIEAFASAGARHHHTAPESDDGPDQAA
jgi:hypothetical protein